MHNKTEHFTYKSWCGVTLIEAFKRKSGLDYEQMTSVFNNITKELENKAILNIKQYYMCCYVAFSNVFQLF